MLDNLRGKKDEILFLSLPAHGRFLENALDVYAPMFPLHKPKGAIKAAEHFDGSCRSSGPAIENGCSVGSRCPCDVLVWDCCHSNIFLNRIDFHPETSVTEASAPPPTTPFFFFTGIRSQWGKVSQWECSIDLTSGG